MVSIVFLIFLMILLASSLVFLYFHLITIFTGAPYLGIGQSSLSRLLTIAKIEKGEVSVDLGSGDGRIVIAMAKKGAIAHGYEINPLLVLISRLKIMKNGLTGRAFIHWESFWSSDLSSFDVITVYGISYIMKKLEKKLKKEIKKSARVISNSYSFKNWKPEVQKDFIFVYKR